MGCCQSYESDEEYSRNGGGGPESAPKKEEGALRKVECSDAAREIIVGGLRLRYAYFSQKGYYPDDPHKPNQDSYKVIEKFGADEANDAFFGVFDGHGRDGDLCAQFTRDHLPPCLARNIAKIKRQEVQNHKPQLNRLVSNSANPGDPARPQAVALLAHHNFRGGTAKA